MDPVSSLVINQVMNQQATKWSTKRSTKWAAIIVDLQSMVRFVENWDILCII